MHIAPQLLLFCSVRVGVGRRWICLLWSLCIRHEGLVAHLMKERGGTDVTQVGGVG